MTHFNHSIQRRFWIACFYLVLNCTISLLMTFTCDRSVIEDIFIPLLVLFLLSFPSNYFLYDLSRWDMVSEKFQFKYWNKIYHCKCARAWTHKWFEDLHFSFMNWIRPREFLIYDAGFTLRLVLNILLNIVINHFNNFIPRRYLIMCIK